MCFGQLALIIRVYFFCLLYHLISLVACNSAGPFNPLDNIAINCGSSGYSTSPAGRQWIGDVGSRYIISQGSKTKPVSSKWIHDQPFSPLSDPYMTTRISRWQFTYSFQVTPGHKFIRLHFYPTLYPGFERSKSFFTVKAGPYTLLSNFSASLTADALGLQFFSKEFCVNVEENQPLLLNFIPSLDGTSGNQVYAFVNGIEIVSIPAGLYHTREGDPGVQVVGRKYRLPIDDNVALEMVQRLTVGGSSILPSEDTGMFREWIEDSSHLLESSVMPAITTMQIKYTNVPTYIAPPKVYQTSWSKVLDKQGNKHSNFTWKLDVDLGFRYLIRFHFCELEYHINEIGHREFTVFINNQMAEANADLIRWGGEHGVALYKDYVMTMEGERFDGKRDLLITLCPCMNSNFGWISEHTDAILKGLEVFKLSNTDNNLAGANPLPVASVLAPGNQNTHKFVYACDGNAFATCVTVLLIFLNIIMYLLRIWGEKFGEGNMSSIEFERLCQEFTLAEIQSMTKGFSDEMVIGRGGFGNVYKGSINDGGTTVAIKRLNPQSKQGANEFWTEIKMLSKVRHAHLVSLIGYCDESSEKILVYEYMEHGTFADHLYKNHGKGDANICHLSWEQRLRICVGAARGLDYLHTGTQNGVIHRDVKTTNILLDKNWEAKISDFGLCKTGTSRFDTHVSTNHVKGTFGYLDPECFYSCRLTKKSDVFSFGVVLLEALCGRRAVDTSLEEEQHSLAIWAQQCIKEEKLDEIIDPRLSDQISSGCLKVIAEVAQRCLQNGSKGRPTMAEVVVSLEGALALQYKFGDSSIEKEENVYEGVDDDDDDLKQDIILSSSNLTEDHDSKIKQVTIITDIGVPLTYEDVVRATGNFNASNCIGSGGFGATYKAEISAGVTVAIQRLAVGRPQGFQQFDAEIKTLGRLRHQDLVTMIGYHASETEMFFIYDYLPGGNLENFIQERSPRSVAWRTLHKIAFHIARALVYLHDQCVPRVLHRDVKPSNILLDDDYNAYLFGFGLARLLGTSETHATTCAAGNSAYVAPECAITGQVSDKADVYSYGMVLLELMSDKRTLDPSFSSYGNGFNIVAWACMLLRQGRAKEFFPAGLWDSGPHDDLVEVLHLAVVCTIDSLSVRPTMKQVVRRLKQLQPPSR